VKPHVSLVPLKEKIASNYYGVNRTENFAFSICARNEKRMITSIMHFQKILDVL